ncbi:MAG: response regulator transcription factor [Chloroflexi bacterium]|jgi:DNA-binding response OmpR family regulator|nr:response regulator transcription factor [Chloroflexota bacterium]
MKVVIIEDDPEIVEAVSLCFDLRWPDVDVVSANEGIDGLGLIEKECPDIVILDVGLPDIDGFEVCRRIRLFSDVPVIMLTVKDQEFDKVKGLELGADDYITKPFSHVELLARVKAVLRRSTMPQFEEEEEPLTVGKIRIDYSSHEVRVDGNEVKLTPTEYSLLHFLARNAGRVIPHRVLLEKVWGADYVDSTDYLKVYIQRLRVKLRDDPQNCKLIISERGVGYKLSK